MKKIKMGSGGKMHTVPISELLEQRIEFQTITSNAPLLAFTIAEGVINPEDKKSNKRDFLMKDKDNKRFELTEKDDIVYNPANVVFGAIHRNALGKGVVSPIYKIFKCVNVDPLYMDCVVSRASFIHELSKYAEGSVTKLRTLAPENFLNLELTVPTDIDEQHKIGILIESLKTKIENEKKQIEKLKALKASMLDKMFPREGATEPEIRFPGFTDAWEQRKVSEVAEICAGGTPSTGIDRYWYPKEIPWVSSGEVHKKYITFTDNKISIEGMNNSSARMIPENSVLIALAGQGKTRGTVAINRIPLTTNQSIAAMTFSNEIVPEFVFSNLENRYEEIRRMSSGDGSRGGLNKQIVGDIEIPYTSKEEQDKIGECFNNLDHLITLHQRKYEKLIDTKKAFLEKLIGGEK